MGKYSVEDYINSRSSGSKGVTPTVTPGQTPFFVNGNYDKLENVPIKNLVGKSRTEFVVLSGVDTGNYVLRGYFKKDSFSALEYKEEPISIGIVKDAETERKILYYFVMEGGESFINKIEYDTTGRVIKDDKRFLEGMKWEDL